MTEHLVIAPVLVPFVAGTVLLAIPDLPMAARRWLALFAALAQVGVAAALAAAVASGDILVYRLGDWPAPWGIVLVADRLAALMVLTTALLALWASIHAGDGLDRRGRHFHVLFQLQMFGLAGAFLTGDLFNLFVFFEILLIASYGLLLHGGGAARIAAGLHYVVLNLLGSTVFLFAAGLLYASLGTLNMADLASRAAVAAPQDLAPARAGGLLLLAVFGLKAALLPLHLWLPSAYAAAAAPVAALFAVMTKVGIYAILRIGTLVFGSASGALAGLYDPWLLPLALATLGAGTLGVLAADSLGRLAAYLVMVSAGTLLAAFSLGAEGIAAGLYYLPHGTFAVAVLFLLAEVVRRRRPASADTFAADADMPRHAFWGGLFFAAAVAAAGLPPLAGFVGKFLILHAAHGDPWVWTGILVPALASLVALSRAGSRLFFSSKSAAPDQGRAPAEFPLEPHSAARESIAVAGLLTSILALTAGAGPAVEYARALAFQVTAPGLYIAAILERGS